MSKELYVGESIYIYQTIYTSDGVTPLSGETAADFDVLLAKNGAAVSLVLANGVNFGEVGSTGTYYVRLTPSSIGDYYFRIKGENDAYSAWREEVFFVRAANSGLSIISKILRNKMTIEEQSNHYYQIIYDDDGETELIKWQLSDKDGNDIILTGRGPTSRDTPEE